MSRTIKEAMTPQTHTIRDTAPVEQAQQLMQEYSVRHLPVLHGAQLCGIISDRDIVLARGFEGADSETLTVEDACTQEVYTAPPETSLKEVVGHMADRRLGCAVVTDANGHVLGIFTTTDACKILAESL